MTSSTRDSAPAYSPDGTQLAFLRAGDDGPPQLHVMPADGGDARRLTDQPLGVGSVSWSPEGTQLVYATRIPEQVATAPTTPSSPTRRRRGSSSTAPTWPTGSATSSTARASSSCSTSPTCPIPMARTRRAPAQHATHLGSR
ncbi:TolB family protein [Serinicoccus sp. CUA-874]|uniref:TolB family protein n=1 Tax=Serinicoccus sp. CUA-874 TaxID=1517939 RepID=UPI0009FA9814|nr:PD40 domain-containing protein [Serinicoccus sp. CUA-874]